MRRVRGWIGSRSLGQILMVCGVLGLGSCGVGAVTYSRWSADRHTCVTAKEFSDSLASNLARLAAIDAVIDRFDLTGDSPVDSEAAATRRRAPRAAAALPDSVAAALAKRNSEPNRLERRIIVLRMEGITPQQIDRWASEKLHVPPLPSGAPTDTAARLARLARIHLFENDTGYVHYLRTSMQVNYDYWHDLTTLEPLVKRWNARCSDFHRRIATLLPLWALATGLLVVTWWWWVVALRR